MILRAQPRLDKNHQHAEQGEKSAQPFEAAVPIPDPDLEKAKTIQLLEGELPSPINPPSGCVFRTRCPLAGPECAKTRPVLEGSFRHAVSCLKVDPL